MGLFLLSSRARHAVMAGPMADRARSIATPGLGRRPAHISPVRRAPEAPGSWTRAPGCRSRAPWRRQSGRAVFPPPAKLRKILGRTPDRFSRAMTGVHQPAGQPQGRHLIGWVEPFVLGGPLADLRSCSWAASRAELPWARQRRAPPPRYLSGANCRMHLYSSWTNTSGFLESLPIRRVCP